MNAFRIGAAALIVSVAAGLAAVALGGTQPLAVTSTIDGKNVLPQYIRWIAHPNVAASSVSEVDYLIDGKLRWVEHTAPYAYGGDDGNGHLAYLFTSWLSPGLHTFTARVKTSGSKTATDTVHARVLPSPAPPAPLLGTWARVVTKADTAKSDPKYGGTNNVPPTGRWRIVIDRTGIWELDPLGTGIVQAYSATSNALHAYAPVMMVPKKANGDPGEIRRFGNRVDAGGGIDCDESGPFGTYRWSVSGDRLTLSATHELCGQRRAIYEGSWTRIA